ncbi:MAG: SlyX family protein [Myxococcales bacterium]|nr:SlyX family protein [Myxococcales bacterium]
MMPDAEPTRQQQASNEVDVRLSELEIRSEFQARTMEDLDAVVREFAERVDRLERELKELRNQLEVLTGEDGDDDDDT